LHFAEKHRRDCTSASAAHQSDDGRADDYYGTEYGTPVL
jgi:hypothetical protein